MDENGDINDDVTTYTHMHHTFFKMINLHGSH